MWFFWQEHIILLCGTELIASDFTLLTQRAATATSEDQDRIRIRITETRLQWKRSVSGVGSTCAVYIFSIFFIIILRTLYLYKQEQLNKFTLIHSLI